MRSFLTNLGFLQMETHRIPAAVSIAPKHHSITAEIRRRIRQSRYRGLLPTERQLAAEFRVNVKTLRKAVNALVADGLVYRRRGSGTYVAGVDDESAVGHVALLVRAHGHVFGPLATTLCQLIQARGGLLSIVDVLAEGFRQDPARTLERLLTANVRRVAVMALPDFPYPVLRGFTSNLERLVFTFYEPIGASVPADQVISDTQFGAASAVLHLIAEGHSQILLAGGAQMARDMAGAAEPHRGFAAGYLQALSEAGLSAHSLIWAGTRDTAGTYGDVVELIRKHHVTAVFATTDGLAVRLARALRQEGLRVPEDVAMVGYYNTPWCEWTDVPLSSVSVREDEIARLTAERLLCREPPGQTFTVMPQLMVRQSSSDQSTVAEKGKVRP